MYPLNPLVLQAMVVATGLPRTKVRHPGDAIVNAFQAYDEMDFETLDERSRKVFWECAKYLTFANTFGSAARAEDVLVELEAVFPGFEFREPEPVSEPENESEADAGN